MIIKKVLKSAEAPTSGVGVDLAETKVLYGFRKLEKLSKGSRCF